MTNFCLSHPPQFETIFFNKTYISFSMCRTRNKCRLFIIIVIIITGHINVNVPANQSTNFQKAKILFCTHRQPCGKLVTFVRFYSFQSVLRLRAFDMSVRFKYIQVMFFRLVSNSPHENHHPLRYILFKICTIVIVEIYEQLLNRNQLNNLVCRKFN